MDNKSEKSIFFTRSLKNIPRFKNVSLGFHFLSAPLNASTIFISFENIKNAKKRIKMRSKQTASISTANSGCRTRIRTQTNRVRVCRATFTQSGNMHKSRLILYRTSRKSQVLCRYFWKNVGAWRGTDWERYDGRTFSKNTVPWGKCPQKT